MSFQIHFAVATSDAIRPICRDLKDRANWTIQRDVVTCPECLRVLHSRQRTPPGQALAATAATRLVVIIEDDRDAAVTLAEALESGGHRAHVALTGRAGIDLVGQLRPDAVICDIWLPDMDGYDVARMLRGNVKYEGRLIAFTGLVYQRNGDRAADAGFDVFLAKPADRDALIHTIGGKPSGASP